MPSSTPTLDHTAITVSDMATSVSFYRDLLVCQVVGEAVREDSDVRMVFLQAGQARLELFEFAEKGKGIEDSSQQDLGLKHLAFRVDDVDAFARTLREKGVVFTLEPKDGFTVERLAFFEDPDVNTVEILSGQRDVLRPFRS